MESARIMHMNQEDSLLEWTVFQRRIESAADAIFAGSPEIEAPLRQKLPWLRYFRASRAAAGLNRMRIRP